MEKLKMYCLSRYDSVKNKIKDLDYTPVGLGTENYSEGWIRDNTGENISNKNKFYGEYTFHYWLWKNELKNIPDNTWIGFCAYRRFWNKNLIKPKKIENLSEEVLKNVSSDWANYDVILGDEMDISRIKWIKVIKYGKISFLRNPLIFLKKNRNIRFHFDMFHGNGNLDKAIDLLDEKNRNDFRNYVKNQTSYNQGNMFITKSKKIIDNYYSDLFSWLKKCEDLFGFDLDGYGKTRIYAFLAERFLPYWFNKYTNVLKWPILFYDINKNEIKKN